MGTLSISDGDYRPLSPISSSPSPCPPAPATARTGATRVTFNLPHPCASPSSALRLSSVRGRLDGVTGTLRPGAGPDSTGNVTVSVPQLTRGGCPEGHRWCQRCPGVCVCLWLCLYMCVCLFLSVCMRMYRKKGRTRKYKSSVCAGHSKGLLPLLFFQLLSDFLSPFPASLFPPKSEGKSYR